MPNTYQCFYCDKIFSSGELVISHYLNNHDDSNNDSNNNEYKNIKEYQIYKKNMDLINNLYSNVDKVYG